MLELQKYLQTHSLEELKSEFFIKTNRHSIYPHLIQFKYSQIESPMCERIVQESRGIILDESNNWAVVAYPFDKCFNYGEGHAVNIDWGSAVVEKKYDGTCCMLWYNPYSRCYEVSTLGSIEANGSVSPLTNLNFKELFWQVWNSLNYELPCMECFTYTFELTTPLNRIVVQQEEYNLTMIGVRDILNLKELYPKAIARAHKWKYADTYPLHSLDSVVTAANNLSGIEGEGFIVKDANFNRIKIKSSDYVSLHHLKTSFSLKKLLEIVRTNEGEEWLTYFTEYKEIFNTVKTRYNNLVEDIQNSYNTYSHISDRKEFAISIQNLPYKGIMFSLKAGQVQTVKEALAKTLISHFELLMALQEDIVIKGFSTL